MKKLAIISTVLLICTLAFAQSPQNYKEAIAFAKANNKNIALQFSGSDWCAPCIKLEKNIINTSEFKNYAQKFVWLKVDFPRKKANRLSKEQEEENEKLAAKFNPNGLFPMIVFIDSEEQIIASIKYFNVSPAEYIAKIETLLNK